MSFGLARDRELSDACIGVTAADLPPLPDAIITDRNAGRIDPRAWFADPSLPLEIEIGVGKGTFLVNQAPADPHTNYLGIEWAYEFYLYSADRLRRRAQAEQGGGLANVRLLHANAVDFLKWRCPSGIICVVHLYFSDPWPKKRHHKNRVIQNEFLAEAWRVLAPGGGGELRIVTDHDESWAWNLEHFDRWTSADPATDLGVPRPSSGAPFTRESFTPPTWVGDGELIGTNYERKFQRDDRPAHSCVLRKQA